jgi:hypothetical protein
MQGLEFFPANLESLELLILRKRETRIGRYNKELCGMKLNYSKFRGLLVE